MSTIHKYEFGMADLSATMSRRFNTAVDIASLFLDNKISPQEVELEAISELKGMFNRSLRKDQWNWFTVYDRLGYPPKNEIRYIVSQLDRLRKSLKDRDFERALSIRSNLADSTLPNYLSQWKHYAQTSDTRDKGGWLYILSRKDEPGILKIGMTTRSVPERVKEINSATGVLRPYSARQVYKVENAKEVEQLVFKLLASYRIREDREFFQIPFGKVVKMIEEEIFALLTRKQGEVKWFNESKGYGFITCKEHEHQNIFVHKSQILDGEIRSLQRGQKVKFDIAHTKKGVSAIKVALLKE